jgi:hypothetical protein
VLRIMGQHGFKAIPRRAKGQKDQRRSIEPRDSAGQTSAHPIPLVGSHRKSNLSRHGVEPSTQDTAGRLTHPKAADIRVTKSGPSRPQAIVRPRALTPSPPLFLHCGLQAACRRSDWCNTGTAPEVFGGASPCAKQPQSDGRRRVSKFGCLRFSGVRRSSISTWYRVR